MRRTRFEPRPANRRANRRRPSAAELRRYRRLTNEEIPYRNLVTGRFAGTTDEILQWAAWKWGIDEDLLRAQAVAESTWRQHTVGDGGLSFGLMQIKRTVWRGTHPLSARSTAFNVDYYGALFRTYYDGHSDWFNNDDGRGADYRAGDLWGTIGAHWAGRWRTDLGLEYVGRVRTELRARRWAAPGFVEAGR